MKACANVSRKTVGEDRVAICPNFGCEYMTRVKPLKFRFLGFGKHPKCKKHHVPLVYVDERIVDFVDAALACLFDKAGLPPSELLEGVKSKFPDEVTSFVEGWVYCITAGRGAPIVSRYMDTISNTYLKQLTKKQIKALKKGVDSQPNLVNKAIKDGMDEIAMQYTRILKHLRVHSEILVDHQKLKSLSISLQNFLKDWQKQVLNHNEIMNSPESEREMTLQEIKRNYDQILNIGTCRCLLGLNPESKEIKKAGITAFDRFSAYFEFLGAGITSKFTKSDISNIISISKINKEKIQLDEDIDQAYKKFEDYNCTSKVDDRLENLNIITDQSHKICYVLDGEKWESSINMQRKIWIEIINRSSHEFYLEDVFNKLRQKDPRITKEWIQTFLGGGRFSSYIKGARMPYKRFLKLRELVEMNLSRVILYELYCFHSKRAFGFENDIIPHKLFLTIKDNVPYKPLPKNSDTAELISIMLGDGHLHPIEKDKVVQISLNLVDEEHYFEYVGKLLKKIFPHSEFRMKENQGKGVDWITTNSRIHFAICELGRGLNKTGLIPGNKVENQVSEPEWVLSSNIFIKKGLKGLFDTDGSIGVSRKSQFILTFSNSSKNLVNDFYFMCKKIGLDKIGNIVDIGHNTWRVPIYDSEEIKKFLNIVKPEKFQEPYRRLWLGLNIIYRRAPKSIRIKIEEYLNEWRKTVGFNRKYFSYTKENTELLKEWIEILFRESCLNYVFGYKFDYYISNEMIESALRTGLLSQYECISYSLDCNNRYRVHWFPEKLRNNIIDCITKYLKYSTDQIIFFVFEQLISNSQWMAILNPFNESEYNDTLKNYLESMILVIKEIDRYKTKNGNYHSLGHYTLETYFKNKGINLAFSRKVIKKILDYFKAQIYE